MNRRKLIKALALGVVTPHVFVEGGPFSSDKNSPGAYILDNAPEESFASSWKEWPDMNWAGPEYWGNRLQDWRVRDGKLECVVRGNNRSLHCLTTQLTARPEAFENSVTVNMANAQSDVPGESYVGFRLGAKAVNRFEDYRCAAVFGEGLDAGLTMEGHLFIGIQKSPAPIRTREEIRIVLQSNYVNNAYQLKLSGFENLTDKVLAELTVNDIPPEKLIGNLALVCHFANEKKPGLGISADGSPLKDTSTPAETSNSKNKEAAVSASFSDWKMSGPKLSHNPAQTFGPICFAQYTLHKKIVKITAQLAPVELITGHKCSLQIKKNNEWATLQESKADVFGRTAHFRLDNWLSLESVPYRVKLELPLKNSTREYFYEGTMAAEPVGPETLKVAVFSCNADYGFPDTEIAPHVEMHKPDMAVFLGDQFYEGTGGFQIQTHPFEMACLDYLRKWYMFGWSYREVFRHIPTAFIPDDHDVYHGNVWGEGGKHAPSDKDWAYVAQDQGGYKMAAAWINMVQRTQTSHLPDPFDPTPVQQGIGVYYTNWNYGGVSFAILEDRKFKSAPKNVLPAEARVQNGFIQNPDFDIKKHREIPAELLGDRQMRFLSSWATDWQDGVKMKAVLSQTNFCTVATLPQGSIIDSIVPRLPIPEPGQYVTGDAPTFDMDSNGWPQKGRDEALKIIRKCFAFHIAGDQHLASMVQYGVENFGDAGYAFAGPALNNLFPRRWWPSPQNHHSLPGKPAYTGDFLDGFGNHMTIHAVANPRKTTKQPALIHDRATGYGIVTFDKGARTIRTECWPRYINPQQNPNGQYHGWPLTISQEENYGRLAQAWLPEIKVNGLNNPVIEIREEPTGELVYCLRVKGNRFKPKVFAKGSYTIRVRDPDSSLVIERHNVEAQTKNNTTVVITV